MAEKSGSDPASIYFSTSCQLIYYIQEHEELESQAELKEGW